MMAILNRIWRFSTILVAVECAVALLAYGYVKRTGMHGAAFLAALAAFAAAIAGCFFTFTRIRDGVLELAAVLAATVAAGIFFGVAGRTFGHPLPLLEVVLGCFALLLAFCVGIAAEKAGAAAPSSVCALAAVPGLGTLVGATVLLGTWLYRRTRRSSNLIRDPAAPASAA